MKMKIIIIFLLVFPISAFCSDTLDYKELMSPRNAVVEVFTNTGSVEGARSYALLNYYLRNHPQGTIPIVYHTKSPFSYDPFYQIDRLMNMKRWSMYSTVFDMSLDNSAAVGGHYFAGNRDNIDSLLSAIEGQKNIIVPLKMSINMSKIGDSLEITVHLQSAADYGRRTLFIFLMDSYYTKYDLFALSADDRLTPNTEAYFRWIPRAMVPDSKGIEVSLYNGTDTTITVKASAKYLFYMNNSKLYATALVQSPTSTNLIQAVTTYKPISPKIEFQGKNIQTGDSSYVIIKRGEQTKFKVTLENPYDFEQKYNAKLFSDSKLFYISFGRFDDSIFVLQPYEKRDFEFLIVSQNWSDFSRLDLVIRPIEIADPKYQEDALFHSVFCITEGIKCVTMHTYPKLEADAESLDNLIYDFSDDWAVCPYDVFMKGFADMPVKLYYLMLDTRNIPTFGVNKRRVDFAQGLLDQGKGVILTSVYELGLAQDMYKKYAYSGIPEMKGFLNDKIGISLGHHLNTNKNNTYSKINVFGISGMDFGRNVTVKNCKINDYFVITKTSDLETLKANGTNSTTKGFLRYDILDLPTDEFAGVTSEVSNGRVAYIGFGLENSAYYGRKNIVDNIIYWLMKEAKPKRSNIVVKPNDYIDFGDLDLYKEKIINVSIKNTGEASLSFEDIAITKYNESFSYDTSQVINPLAPGESFNLPIKFKPKKRKNMQTDLEIKTNSYYSSYKSLTLIGRGVLPPSAPPPEGGNDFWLDISSSKLSNNINIKFEPDENAKSIKLSLVDSKGNVFNMPYSPKPESAMQTFTFDKKLFTNESYELQIEIDGKLVRKAINAAEVK